MPPKRAESPSHGPATTASSETAPSVVGDLPFLTELLETARGVGLRGARPTSSSTSAIAESPTLNTSSRPASRISGGARDDSEMAVAPVVADQSEVTEEEIVWRLTSMLLRCREVRCALGSNPSTPATAAAVAEDENPQAYWTDLALQLRVDHLVEAIRYCAARDFTVAKAQHVLSWLLRYEALVCSGVEGDTVAPLPPLSSPLRDGSGSHNGAGSGTGSGAATPTTSTAAAANGTPANGSRKGHSAGSAPAAKSSGRVASQRGGRASDGASSDAAAAAATATQEAAPSAAKDSSRSRPYLDALAEELSAFAEAEVAAWWRWQLVPRQPKERDPALVAALGPPTANGKGNSNSSGTASATGAGKKKMSERTRLLLQLEEEEEEKRLAMIASLPPQNIFLSEPEVEALVNFFVVRGWVPHAALYRILACQQRPRDPPTAPVAVGEAVPPSFASFEVVVEQPAPIPPLATAAMTELSVEALAELDARAALSCAPTASAAASAQSSSVGGGAGGGSGAHGKAASTRPRSSVNTRKPELSARTRAASDVIADEKAATAGSSELTHTPIDRLRAEQETELAVLERQHADWCAHKAEEARLAQLERDMELHLDRQGADAAARDVYESLESQLTERELRILQRVEALEITLGMRPPPGGDAEDAAAANSGSKPQSRSASGKRGGRGKK